jgi:hypothetical protein
MDNLNNVKMFLIVIVIVCIYLIIVCKKTKKVDKFINITNPFVEGLSTYQLGTTVSPDSQILKIPTVPLSSYKITEKKLNPYYIQSKFSDNYRDVMTAIYDLCPNQKTLFNLQTLPVTTTTFNPEKEYPLEVYKIIIEFINQLNDSINKLPESNEIINDYNNYLPMTSQTQKYIKNNGINKFYNEIGVDFNLYADTPQNAPVELIKIIEVIKDYTESDTRYKIKLVIHKVLKSVSEQMELTVYFIYRNDIIDGENLFRKVQNLDFDKKITIEYIFINGFYIDNFNKNFEAYGKDDYDKPLVNDPGNFYKFDMLNENKMLSANYIQNKLNEKLQEHRFESINFNNPYPINNLNDSKNPKWI